MAELSAAPAERGDAPQSLRTGSGRSRRRKANRLENGDLRRRKTKKPPENRGISQDIRSAEGGTRTHTQG
jgi:hypothetical protein